MRAGLGQRIQALGLACHRLALGRRHAGPALAGGLQLGAPCVVPFLGDRSPWAGRPRASTCGCPTIRPMAARPRSRPGIDLDRRMRNGEISLAIEIPPNFARDVEHGRPVEVGAWIDGAMPTRAETIQGYVQGTHLNWLSQKARELYGNTTALTSFNMEIRYRYNPDVQSLVAMVPAVIPLLLLVIPAMLSVLSVVREKELGSIINFYVTPVTKFEFLIGKQLPYVGLAFFNFLMLTAFAVFIFQVRFTGSFLTYSTAALLYVIITTGMGLVLSTFMNSQIAAIFGTALMTLIPAVQYSGIIDPVSSLRGAGALIGQIYPTTYFTTISRGTFSKALSFSDLGMPFLMLLITIPVLMVLGIVLLKKQAR